jgi:uncharacterized membrane protein YdbT with pleckstrin-like domain
MAITLLIAIFYVQAKKASVNSIFLYMAIGFIVLIFLGTEIHRFSSVYYLDAMSLMCSKGIFKKEIKKISFPSISDINLHQNFWQRILGFGTIFVSQYSGSHATPIKNINKPLSFLNKIEHRLERI